MSESQSDHFAGGEANPSAPVKKKRPWVKPVLTCETLGRTSAKPTNPSELGPVSDDIFGPAS
jgi:hypothetical protein